MEILYCENCKRLFQYPGFGERLCPACKKEDDEEFEKVKKYLMDNPGSNKEDLFEATGVDIKKIMRWLKEERLISRNTSGLGLTCEQCGSPILSGKLCDECKRKIAVEFGYARKNDNAEAKKEPAAKRENRMRFLNTR